MPPEHGRRLAELFPNDRLVEIGDSYTLIPEEQPAPALLASDLRRFIADTGDSSRSRSASGDRS
jgi:hypothetical protein